MKKPLSTTLEKALQAVEKFSGEATTEEQVRRTWDELVDVIKRLCDEVLEFEARHVEFLEQTGVDCLADIPELLASLRKQCSWQPIETAPLNTKVDILMNGKARIAGCKLSYDGLSYHWWIDDLGKEVGIDWDIGEITHWMPIAALPVKDAPHG